MNYTIRPIRLSDAESMHALRIQTGVFETLFATPTERITGCEEYIAGMGPNTHSLAAVVEKDGEEIVIGHIALEIPFMPRRRHVGQIGVMIHKDYQNQGVGSELFRRMLDVADNWLMLQRLELTVFANNRRARHLYEKMGFQEEGVMRMAVIQNGAYTDEIMMGRIRPETQSVK